MKHIVLFILLSLLNLLGQAQSDSIQPPVKTVLDGVYIPKKIISKESLLDYSHIANIQMAAPFKVEEKKHLPKAIREFTKDMRLISGGYYETGHSLSYQPTKQDSTLLFFADYNLEMVYPFLLCDHEVTNKEYREFTKYVLDSCMRDALAQADIEGFTIFDDRGPNKVITYWIQERGIYDTLEKALPEFDTVYYRLNWKTKIDMNEDDIFNIIRDGFYLQGQDKFYDHMSVDSHKIKYRFSEFGTELLVAIYPDTLAWLQEGNGWYQPLEYSYFWYPAYDNYPVVGVTQEQAQAYCHWKSWQLNELLKKHKLDSSFIGDYCLPKEYEWEFAAATVPYNTIGTLSSVMSVSLDEPLGFEPIPECNIGDVHEINGYDVDRSDGDDMTSQVKSYEANRYGLYDMAGNVAEWVLHSRPNANGYADTTFNNFNCKYFMNTEFEISKSDSLETVKEKIRKHNGPMKYEANRTEYEELLHHAAEVLLHDARVKRSNPNASIAKGGSWATAPVYAVPALKEVFTPNEVSSHVGFRVALSITPDAVPYFIDNDYFKKMKNSGKKE